MARVYLLINLTFLKVFIDSKLMPEGKQEIQFVDLKF